MGKKAQKSGIEAENKKRVFLQQLTAVMAGMQAEMATVDRKERQWRSLLRIAIIEIFAKGINESFSRVGVVDKSKTRAHPGLRCRTSTAQAIVAALSLHLERLGRELADQTEDEGRFTAMARISDASYAALAYAKARNIRAMPTGWKFDPAVLAERAKLVERGVWPLDDNPGDDAVVELKKATEAAAT